MTDAIPLRPTVVEVVKQGPQGPAIGDWRGAWAAGSYRRRSLVEHVGSLWLAKQPTAGEPGVSLDWDLLVSGETIAADELRTDLASNAADKGADLINLRPVAAGAKTRTVRDLELSIVNVLQFLDEARTPGTTDDRDQFEYAAQFANGLTGGRGIVVVPPGVYRLNSPTTTKVTWVIYGADFRPLAAAYDAPGSAADLTNTSRLAGKVIHYPNMSSAVTLRIGAPDAWLERDWWQFSEGISEVAILSSIGKTGLLTASRTSDDPAANYAGIAHACHIVNDNIVNRESAWANYTVSHRAIGAGPTFGEECDFWNRGDTVSIDPYTVVDPADGRTVAYWTTCGAEVPGNDISAAWALHSTGAKFHRGWVARAGSIDPTLSEAAAWATGYKLAWYDGANSVSASISDKTLTQAVYSDTQSDSVRLESHRRKADKTSATTSLDRIHRSVFYGYSGSADYQAAYIQCLQRTNFSGGNAGFSLDFTAKATDGTDAQVTLNGLASKSFAPNPDNTISLGTGSFRWSQVYAANATISTSDETLKTPFRAFTDAERDALLACRQHIGLFQWLDAVSEKGDDARLHAGLPAQACIAEFVNRGLDPWRYAWFCRDPKTEMVTHIRRDLIQVHDEETVEVDQIVVEEGKAIRKVFTKTKLVPRFRELPVYDESGAPVMEEYLAVDVEATAEALKVAQAEALASGEEPPTRVAPVRKPMMRPMVHSAPVMEERDIEYTEQVDTGEYIYSIRYTELLAAMIYVAA